MTQSKSLGMPEAFHFSGHNIVYNDIATTMYSGRKKAGVAHWSYYF
jgi:hypothetical protein